MRCQKECELIVRDSPNRSKVIQSKFKSSGHMRPSAESPCKWIVMSSNLKEYFYSNDSSKGQVICDEY